MPSAEQAFVRFGKEGELANLRITSSSGKTKAEMDALKAKVTGLADGMEKDMRRGASAVVKLGEDGTASLVKLTQSLDGISSAGSRSIPVLSGLATAAASAGGAILSAAVGLGPMVVGIAALGIALSPVIVLLGAFAVGLTAVVGVMTLGLGAIGALGAGIVLLAAHTQQWIGVTQTVPQAQSAAANAALAHTAAVQALDKQQQAYNSTTTHTAAQTLALQQAQQKVTDTTLKLQQAQDQLTAAQNAGDNPLKKLTDDLGGMADRLGKQAAPAAAQMLGFLDQLTPRVEKLASGLISGFSARLPQVIDVTNRFADSMFKAFDKLGPVADKFFNSFLARGPRLNDEVFRPLLDIGVKAIDGLLTNLLRLSDWFVQRLPTMGPIVGQIMGKIGDVIQGVGTVAGQVVDWFIAHWPQITETANGAWANIKAGWDAFAPVLQKELPEAANLASQFLGYLHDHSDVVRAVFVALGLAASLLVGAIAAVGTIALGIISAIQFLYEKFNALMNAVDGLANSIWGVVSALGAIPGKAGAAANAISSIPVVGGALGAITGNPQLASGGPALPGRVYTVGEAGPETLVMGASGGYVIPNAGGGAGGQNVTINIIGAGMNPEQVAMAIDRRLSGIMRTA